MKTKLFTLLLAVAASIGTMFANGTKIGELYYNLNETQKSAEVTYELNWDENNYKGLTIANIPVSVTYNGTTYSVTSIGEGAFCYCSSLTSVTIPNSVTSIEYSAFCYCYSLTSVTIPNSVTSIRMSAFYGVNNIIYSGTATGSPWGAKCVNGYVDGYLVYSDATKTTLLGCSAAATGEIVIPNSVTSIGNYAFNGCSSLTSVTIPNSVTSIGNSAFSGCSGLTSVTIPNSVTSIGERAFYGCSSLTSVTIPNSVTSIGDEAFRNCSGLTSVTIPSSVTSIGYRAFWDCSNLTSVEIPNSVTSIGDEAFSGCSSLTSVDAPAAFFDLPEAYWPYYTKILRQVKVNSGELTENALLFINRSYKTLQTLDVSDVTNTEFADEAFKDCYNLQVLVLPEGLQKVGYMMVAGCKNLQAIDIPASVEEIEQSAFEDCRSIKSITFGGASSGAPGRFNAPAAASQLKKIGNWAFYNAHELQHLDIPEGVEEIGDGAFYGCTYLEDMVLPSSIRAIGDNCFALCGKLTKIVCNATTPPAIQAKTFYDVNRLIPVYVPDESVASYESDEYWKEFDIQGASDIESAVSNMTNDSATAITKVMRDGQVLILRDGKTYTIQGVEVK